MYLSRPPCGARHARRVIDVAVGTVPVVLRPQAALSEMLPVRSAAGLHGTPNERTESPCECPFACRGRPLAASLAQSVRCRRDESARIATAHRYTPALHGLRCRRVDSPPLMHAYTRCSNLHRRSRVHVHVVCLHACSGAAESHEEIASARIDHAYTHSSSLQISHTGYR